MIAVDSSVAVAAFAEWQADHEAARRAIVGQSRIVAHAALETYSVLTRLPRPYRLEPDMVMRLLRDNFSDAWIEGAPGFIAGLLDRVHTAGISGGSVYDALVGLTAQSAGATLLTRDRRALRTYDALDVPYRLLTG